jgi:hypothetical protein
MHKIKLILLLILPISVFAQDLGIIDTRTTKNPALNGTYRISTDGKNLFFRNFIGISEKVANTDSATFTGLIKLNSGVNNIEIDQTQIMFRRTNETTMNLGNYRAYGHYFFTGSTYAGLSQAMSINNYGQVNIGNQILDGIISPTRKFQVGATGSVSQRIVSQSGSATIELSGATGGTISNSTGNLNYTSVGSHIFDSKVTLPDSTRIGVVSPTELSYLDGVTSSIQTQLGNKQPQLNGTGFVKASGTTISYDNSTYLTTSSASSTYLPISNPTATGTLTAPTIENTLGANFATTSGNVGIGTTSPSQKLHVESLDGSPLVLAKGANYPAIISTSTTNNVGTKIQSVGVSQYGFVGTETNHRLAIGTNNTERMSVQQNGNVGIGTTAPQNLLHIKGTSSLGVGVRNSHLIIESAETASVDVGAVLKFAGQSGNTVNPYSFGTIEGKKESALTNNYSSYLAFHTIESNGGSTERMRIGGNGNIGVGISSTTFKFHVNGGNIYVGGVGAGVRIEDRSLSSRSFQLYVDGGAFAFFNHNNSTQPVTITDGGNVLVGTTTNAGFKLDVNGTSRFTSKMIMNSAFNSGLSLLNGSSNGQIYNDGNLHLEAAEYLWINGNSNSLTQINAGGGNTYINSGGGRVGIGTTTPAASAVLDITSTTQGVLFPRLTTTQIGNITSPANGLTVYNTTLSVLCFYDGTAWKKIQHSNM